MTRQRTIRQYLEELGVDIAQLVELSGLDQRIVEAIVAGRYTTSPSQRQRIASALGLQVEQIQWGQAKEVDHMYGHGPQFGRSP